uniref:ELYS-like domain-containing protein n=1 Tax=Zea mays TaxID=4577 RepID=Q5GA20_MAIZE|nr:unknown protein [Zea mays]
MPRRPNHLAPCTLCCLLPACCHCISHLPLSAWMTIGVAEHGLWMCIRVHLVKLRAMKKLLLYKLDYGGMEDARPGHQEACSHLPKISSKETHPKIAQVLLERQKYDMALLVLKCTGHGSFSATENFKKDDISSLSEAVTVVRVRIECRLLTEAFMYHRSYCSKVKEQHSADMTHAEDALKNSWVYHVEMMVTEFCAICIKRNLVDKMIDLPWDSEEEKHLHKSLFDSAHEMPMKPNGSLLVVYYLRRYRYLEAYEVDRSLQKFEQKILENTTEEIASKIRAIARWRESLVFCFITHV